MTKLTEQQKSNWAIFERIRLNSGAPLDNLDAMQAVVREFALLMIEQDPNQEAIVISGQTLRKFPCSEFSTKAAYLAHHRRNRVWGEDPILFTALSALGYQPVMHLVGTRLPAYVPFEQKTTRTPLAIHILNHGAVSGGYHWELKGKSNPGDGNCMYYTVAQQIQLDFPKIAPTIQAEIKEAAIVTPIARQQSTPDLRDSAIIPKTKEAAVITPIARQQSAPDLRDSAIIPKTEVKSSLNSMGTNDISQEVIAASIRYAQIHTDAFEAMKQQLTVLNPNQLSTEQLLSYYQELRDMVDDTYLEGRLKQISIERGDETIAKVINGILPIGAADQNALRAELIHALARESSLRDSSYNYLSAHLNPILKIEANSLQGATQKNLPALSEEKKTTIVQESSRFFSKKKDRTTSSNCRQDVATVSDVNSSVNRLTPA